MGVAWLVECLPGMHEALAFADPQCLINQEWWYISALGRWRQDDQKFKVIRGYKLSLKAVPGSPTPKAYIII